MSEQGICPVWGTMAIFHHANHEGKDVESSRAGGRYFIAGTAAAMLDGGYLEESGKARLTTWLVDQRNLGIAVPKVYANTLEDAKAARPLGIVERKHRLLLYIVELTPTFGKPISFGYDKNDKEACGMLAWTESTSFDEISHLIRDLNRKDFFERFSQNVGSESFSLSVDGFEYVENLKNRVAESSQAFVAMWFDDNLDEVYKNGFDPAIRKVGYKPKRLKGEDFLEKIDDKIIAEIRRSRFLVADFTQDEKGARGSVYYEAGFAQGLDIPVIFTCRDNCIKLVHFDTRQYPHIVWKDADDLRKQLEQRIGAVIGDGPFKERT